MLKRKADSDKQDDADGARKARTAAGASAQVDDSNRLAMHAALAPARPIQHMAAPTLELSDAVKATGGSYTQRMQTLVDLLKEDASRPRPLIDLSLVPDGDETCVMFQLIRFLRSFKNLSATADIKADKAVAQQLIADRIGPHQRLLRSFNPTTVDDATGNNALHEMCRLFLLSSAFDWSHRLTELLITHGVSLHGRNKKGRTPLLQWAAASSKEETIASGLRLLLARGADLNAQDGDGNGLLHLLVENKAAALLNNFLNSPCVNCLDFSLRNSAGQTAAELAAVRLAERADSSADSPERRIRCLLATRTTAWVKLLGAINGRDSSYTQRMHAVADLLKEDADRSESQIDLSLAPGGTASCMLFQLLHLFADCIPDGDDDDDVEADKIAADDVTCNKVLPLMPVLLRSFDPATVNAITGNNALHEMCELFACSDVNDIEWPFELMELIIERGVSVHGRDREGRTPLLEFASNCGSPDVSARGLLLLLSHGAELNAQDGEGNGVLHHLIQNQAADAVADLTGSEGVAHLDFTLRNDADQTAADLAAARLADREAQASGEESEDEEYEYWQYEQERRAGQIQQLIRDQTAKWIERVRPVLLRHLESALSVTDLAKLTLGYIDGSGLPFAKAAEAESDENASPASPAPTVAAAAQSSWPLVGLRAHSAASLFDYPLLFRVPPLLVDVDSHL